MSTPVDTTFVRRNNGNFPVVADNDVGGGMQVVQAQSDRDNIQTGLRKAGMLVWVIDDQKLYQLQNDLTSWDIFAGGSGGGLPSMDGNAHKFLRVKQDETDAEWVALTQDMILPGFAVSSFGGPVGPLELGVATSDPAFTAVYSQTAVSATLNDGAGALAIAGSLTAFAYDGVSLPARGYTSSVINHTQSWTLIAQNADGNTATASTSIQWQARAFWGIATPATINEAFIEALSNNGLEAAFARQIAFLAPGGTKKLYYAFPTTLGTPTRFIDDATGFSVPFSQVGSAVPVTNSHGVLVPGGYDVWASDNFLVAAVTVNIS